MGIAAKHLAKKVEQSQEQMTFGYKSYDTDPRPDLKKVIFYGIDCFAMQTKQNEELAKVLHAFRCGGTRIRKVKGWYVLRPDVDPAGKVAWEKQEDYEEMRDKYLKPHLDVMKDLMKQLTKEVEEDEKRSA